MTRNYSNHIKENYYHRPVELSDTTAIQAIVKEVLLEYGLVPDPDGIDSDLNDVLHTYSTGYFGVLVSSDDRVMGCFGLYPMNLEVCEIRKMYFKPKWRGKGLGKWTVKFLISKARELGFKKIELETASPLIEAISLYRKLGFKEIYQENSTPRCDKSFELMLN